jgi:hypothetical protein
MKKIGFIDYYISEWHANNYPVWMKEVCEKIGEDFEVAYAWAELDISPVDGRSTDEWCKAFGAEKCESIAELCEKSDYVVILAPSNPEKHIGYVREAFKCGKPTYVDKTFAPNYAEAVEMFEIGKKYGTPFFSTSALRYATELDTVGDPELFETWGYGATFNEYSVHQIEMVVKTMKSKCVATKAETAEHGFKFYLEFENGKKAEINYDPDTPFAISADGSKQAVSSPYFKLLIADILRFFNTKKTSFDTAETLEVMRIREELLSQITE